LAETDQLGNTKQYEYDDEGRLSAVVLPAVPDPQNGGQLTQPRYVYGYDGQGWPFTVSCKTAVGRSG